MLTLLGLGAAPLVASEAPRFERMVAETFQPSAQLIVLGEERHPTRTGVFNETIRADPGYTFDYVRVRLVNNGTVELGVHNWEFSAADEVGSETPATLANAHDDFDAVRLRGHGGAMEGFVIFEMRADARLTKVVWSGDFVSAEGAWGSAMNQQPHQSP